MELNDYLDRCRRLVAETGWMIQGVTPVARPGVPQHRSFWYYTVGLTPLGHPEFTLSGVNPDIAEPLLNDLAIRVRDGEHYCNGEQLEDVIGGGYKVHLLDVTAFKTFPLALVKTLYPQHPQRALQVVLPDAAHRWPWQPGYDMELQEVMWGVD